MQLPIYSLEKAIETAIGVDAEKWIFTKGTKADSPSRIRSLPVLNNQKMKACLEEIADICGITKSLTFYVARHTFATTVTLSNGVPIETMAKMLGCQVRCDKCFEINQCDQQIIHRPHWNFGLATFLSDEPLVLVA